MLRLALPAVLAVAAGCAAPAAERPVSAQEIVVLRLAGFETLAEVGSEMLIGSQPTPEGLSRARDAGVKLVVNLRPEDTQSFDERSVVEAMGLTYVSIPFTATTLADSHVATFRKLLADTPPEQRILLHCSTGNRAAALWALHEIADLGVTPEAAVARARRLGLTSPELIGFIGDWSRRHGKP